MPVSDNPGVTVDNLPSLFSLCQGSYLQLVSQMLDCVMTIFSSIGAEGGCYKVISGRIDLLTLDGPVI